MTPSSPLIPPEAFAAFKAEAARVLGVNLEAYKPRQMERRVAALMRKLAEPDLLALTSRLAEDTLLAARVRNELTLNVSEFFRDPDRFEELYVRILPQLLGRFDTLRVWSAGCSQGAELYSVAMLLERLDALERCTFVGTDLDSAILARAEEGWYEEMEVGQVEPTMREQHFRRDGRGWRLVSPAIRARTTFRQHDLLAGTAEPECHLVLCRNVLIYLLPAARDQVLRHLARSLVTEGWLMLGRAERVLAPRAFGLEAAGPHLYRPLGA